MKNICKYLFALMIAFTFILNTAFAKEDKDSKDVKDNKEKVTLYLFRQTGCPHCADEMQYLDANYKDIKSKFNIVVYDVLEANNKDLVLDVTKALGIDYEGAPFNVIGKQHFTGYADSISTMFDEFMNDAYDAQEKDIVAELIAKNKYKDLKSTTLFEAMDAEDIEITSKKSPKSNDSVMIIGIFGAVIVLFGALIFASKKN